jgi:hypothetical protein
MYSNWITLTGLCFNFVGALFLTSAFEWKDKKKVDKNGKTYGTITFGKNQGFSKAGIILLIVGFGIQVGAVILKMASN